MINEQSPVGSDYANWYVLLVRSGREVRVKAKIDSLTKTQYNLYVPQRELFYRFKGVYQKVVKPLFPGYIFVYKEIRPISIILKHAHLKDYLHPVLFDNEFAMVEETEMQLLMGLTGPTGIMKTSRAVFHKDQQVLIISGPLKDLEGRVLYINKRKRKAVLQLEMLNRCIRVAVGIEVLSPA